MCQNQEKWEPAWILLKMSVILWLALALGWTLKTIVGLSKRGGLQLAPSSSRHLVRLGAPRMAQASKMSQHLELPVAEEPRAQLLASGVPEP